MSLITACSSGSTPVGTTSPASTETATQAGSSTPQPTRLEPSPAVTETVTSTLPPPTPTKEVCSPLAEIPLSQLQEMIVNPFAPPPSGSDDPHQGVDFGELFGTQRIAVPGRQVNAVLPGTVAALINDRFPYGNAVIVETWIGDLPAWAAADLPTAAPTPQRKAALTCPKVHPTPAVDSDQQSLYLLYAHMQETPELRVGDNLTCGQKIGAIGSSGNALNPHLHLEARVGPSGAVFPGMSHYDSRATPEEMSAYCLWRTSGHFQLVDPLIFLSQLP
jgi:murein DD-endopeptidase MepM/ murein hydrolase activator NlpD